VAFFALTFLLTWTSWLASLRWVRAHDLPGPYSSPVATALLFLGIVSPAVVALGLTARAGGRDRVRQLVSRLVEWRVGGRWYAFAVGYIVAVKLAAAGAARVIGGEWPAFGPFPLWLLFGAIGSTLLGGQVGEELGWRGYALPHLTERWGWRSGSLVLGVIWAV
jgi:membrane protease YdiL (CAAX protease family)